MYVLQNKKTKHFILSNNMCSEEGTSSTCRYVSTITCLFLLVEFWLIGVLTIYPLHVAVAGGRCVLIKLLCIPGNIIKSSGWCDSTLSTDDTGTGTKLLVMICCQLCVCAVYCNICHNMFIWRMYDICIKVPMLNKLLHFHAYCLFALTEICKTKTMSNRPDNTVKRKVFSRGFQ